MIPKKTSLSQAKRIYECPLVFVAPEEANARLKKPYKPTGKLRKPRDVRPKRDNELSLKQHESLQLLLNIYAEQSSKNYRVSATHVGSLPKLVSANERKKTVIEIGRTSQTLPKIVQEATARNKRRSSKANDIHFPSILE